MPGEHCMQSGSIANCEAPTRTLDAVKSSLRSRGFGCISYREPALLHAVMGHYRLLTDGIADLADNDWQVRLLAVRDLVIAGAGALEDIVK